MTHNSLSPARDSAETLYSTGKVKHTVKATRTQASEFLFFFERNFEFANYENMTIGPILFSIGPILAITRGLPEAYRCLPGTNIYTRTLSAVLALLLSRALAWAPTLRLISSLFSFLEHVEELCSRFALSRLLAGFSSTGRQPAALEG